ncbi:prohead core protein [Xanthomonas phage X1]|nr:prohead core protein [Xanthomonas phage X1]
MQVLVERIDDVRNEILVEEVGGIKHKKYIIEGISIQAEVKNRNGRVYPKELIKPEIDRFIREDIALGRAVGHLNHPANDPRNDYKEVSHKYESLTEDGNNWIGRAVVTTGTPNGRIVAGLMDEGVNMGTSTRALGKTKMFEQRGQKTAVVQSFRLISPGDIVSDPSAPDAYLTNLMEGKEWVWENGLLMEREVEIKKEINHAARTGTLNEAKMIELFKKLVALSNGREV